MGIGREGHVQPDLRFGLVGCGRIGKRHADLLSSGAVSGARLVGVCDIDAARASSFAAATIPEEDGIVAA